MNKPTMRDVADHAGVSLGTVSRVLNAHDNVDAALSAKVRDAAMSIGYAKTPRAVQRQRTIDVSFLVAFGETEESRAMLNSYWSEILGGAERAATNAGARLSYRGIHGLHDGLSIVRQLGGDVPERALLVGPAPAAAVAELRALGTRIVLVDNLVPGVPAVVADHLAGGLAAVDHLLDQGHRRIAYLAGRPDPRFPGADRNPTTNLRTIAYRTALERRGLTVDPALIRRSNLHPDSAARAIGELLDEGAEFSAVFCANDPAAMGAVRELRRRGLDVPRDVSVVGYHDQYGDGTVPRLTTVHVDRDVLGAAAVRLLLDPSEDAATPASVHVFPVDLVVGDSTAPLPVEPRAD